MVGEKIVEVDGKYISDEKMLVNLLIDSKYPLQIKVLPVTQDYVDV
jgi:hypothetical protein